MDAPWGPGPWCEGPGHVPLNEIEGNIMLEKRMSGEAPYYVLGPLPADSGAGYDHITAAIGAARRGPLRGRPHLLYYACGTPGPAERRRCARRRAGDPSGGAYRGYRQIPRNGARRKSKWPWPGRDMRGKTTSSCSCSRARAGNPRQPNTGKPENLRRVRSLLRDGKRFPLFEASISPEKRVPGPCPISPKEDGKELR